MIKTFGICRADLRERTRRFSFLAMLAVALFTAVICVPKSEGATRILVLGSGVFKQGSNPTWIPMAAAMVLGFFLPLFGFVYVKNAIGLDRDTRVIDTLLTNRFPRLAYAFGKFLSSACLLLSLLGVVMLGSLVMVFIQFPGQGISPWAFLSPFLTLVPGLLFVAAFALLTETVPVLRGKFGSVLGIIAIMTLIILNVDAGYRQGPVALLDLSGYARLMKTIVGAGVPPGQITVIGGGDWVRDNGTRELVFHGVDFGDGGLTNTALFLLLSLGMVCLAAVLVERRPLRQRQARTKTRQDVHRQLSAPVGWQPMRWGHFNPLRLAWAEVQRLAAGISLFWLIPALGLWIAGWFTPAEIGRSMLMPILYGWAMLPLSMLGCEEMQTGVYAWLRTIYGAPLRQFFASCLSGVLFSLVLALPFACRMPSAVAMAPVLAWALCVPTMALFLGRVSKTQRLFQVMMVVVLYIYLNVPDVFVPVEPGRAILNSVTYIALAAGIVGVPAMCLLAHKN